MRRILYVTGTRADFGLMLATLRAIHAHPDLDLQVCVTGMHLSERFGMTMREVEASGLPIVARIPVDVDSDSGLGMSLATSAMLKGLSELVASQQPDIVLLLGDRLEMLAGAIAAVCIGIPIAHLHGGERSGTIDESIRHAISKLAHLHLVTTDGSRERLIRMGERPEMVHVVGAPGLVGLRELARRTRQDLLSEHRLDPGQPTAAVLFHPVVQEAEQAAAQTQALLEAVMQGGYQAICLLPNADTGNSSIRNVIEAQAARDARFKAVSHLPREDYVSLVATCDLLIGNSSSGILEAATFGTPVVNVGDRQFGRERNANVFDSSADSASICRAIQAARAFPRGSGRNLYSQDDTVRRILQALHGLRIDLALLKKANTY